MYPLMITLAGLTLLTVGTAWTGRSLLAVLGLKRFRIGSPESYCLALFVGATSWALPIGWMSYLGLSVRAGSLVLLVGMGILAVAVVALGRTHWWTAFRSLGAFYVGLPVILSALALSQLALIRHDHFNVYSDATTYCMTSEWLVNHGFFQQRYNLRNTLYGESLIWVQTGAHMGPNFLFALLQSLCVKVPAMDLFCAISAYGVLLNLAGVYLAVRWCLRLSRFYGLIAIALTGFLANSLNFTATYAFMNQLFGTAFLACGLAILGRGLAPVNQHWRMAWLIGFLHAGLFVYYTEMMPLLLGASLTFGVYALWAARRRGRILPVAGFGLLIAVFGLATANFDVLRATKTISIWTNIIVGWPIPMDWKGYSSFLFGSVDYATLSITPRYGTLHWTQIAGTILLGALCLMGLVYSAFSKRNAVLIGSALVLICLLGYYSLIPDPRTGLPGHRWNLFKLCKFGYPVVLLLQILGLWVVCRDLRWTKAIAFVLVTALALSHWPIHRANAHNQAIHFRAITNSKTPFHELRELRELVKREDPDHVMLGTGNVVVSAITALAIHPKPIANNWMPYHRSFMAELSRIDRVPVSGKCLLVGSPLGSSLTPFRAAWLNRDVPSILRIRSANAINPGEDAFIAHVNGQPMPFDVFSPTPTTAILNFRTNYGNCKPGATLRIVEASGKSQDHVINVLPGDAVQIPIALPPGVSTFTVRILNPATGEKMPAEQREPRYLTIVNPTLQTVCPAIPRTGPVTMK